MDDEVRDKGTQSQQNKWTEQEWLEFVRRFREAQQEDDYPDSFRDRTIRYFE